MNDATIVTAIAGMAVVTYGTRIAGPVLASRLPMGGRTEAFLRALPGAILTALVVPTLAQGPAEAVAGACAFAAAMRGGMLGALVAGVGAVYLLRTVGL